MVKKQYNYQFVETKNYSKQEIQDLTGLSKNTVSPSLEAAGFSTSQRSYPGKELLDYFVPVRKLLDSGMTYEQVRKMRQMNEASGDDVKAASDGSVGISNDADSLDQVIGKGITETVYGAVESAVEDLVEHIPYMAAIALSKAAKEGKIEQAFKHRLREYFATRRKLEFGQLLNQQIALPKANSEEGIEYMPETGTMFFESQSVDTEVTDIFDEDLEGEEE
ncbi:MAG: hypothetical protein AAF959_00605 [Cyanobacteria bacterium P01_D01_bin.56]